MILRRLGLLGLAALTSVAMAGGVGAQEKTIAIELNKVMNTDAGCRLTFVVKNDTQALLEKPRMRSPPSMRPRRSRSFLSSNSTPAGRQDQGGRVRACRRGLHGHFADTGHLAAMHGGWFGVDAVSRCAQDQLPDTHHLRSIGVRQGQGSTSCFISFIRSAGLCWWHCWPSQARRDGDRRGQGSVVRAAGRGQAQGRARSAEVVGRAATPRGLISRRPLMARR